MLKGVVLISFKKIIAILYLVAGDRTLEQLKNKWQQCRWDCCQMYFNLNLLVEVKQY